MVSTAYLLSTVVMAVVGAGALALALRTRRWHRYAPRLASRDVEAGGNAQGRGVSRLARSPDTWAVAYILLVLGFMMGAVVYASGAITGMGMIGALGAILAVYLVVGVYVAMRENGRPSAQAAAGSAVATGMLFVVAVTILLVTS